MNIVNNLKSMQNLKNALVVVVTPTVWVETVEKDGDWGDSHSCEAGWAVKAHGAPSGTGTIVSLNTTI